MDDHKFDTYEEKVRWAISRARSEFGKKDGHLKEMLADEQGHVQGCYHTKPAPTE